jgi:glycosyltransferase involved in cell wall biosynthesis
VKRDRMTLIPNFVDLSDLPVPNDRDPKLFSFVGRLVALKRVEDAVRALRLTEDGGITLQIVGDGPLRRGLERLVETTGLSRRVSFLGFRDDALPLLARSAALVLPSLTEGISRVSMEAMALGRPVIATDIPGNRELIENGVTGFLVPVRNPGAIARCMDTLAADRAIYDAISRSAAEYIVRHRSAAVIVGEYERLYERVMTRGA